MMARYSQWITQTVQLGASWIWRTQELYQHWTYNSYLEQQTSDPQPSVSYELFVYTYLTTIAIRQLLGQQFRGIDVSIVSRSDWPTQWPSGKRIECKNTPI